MSHTTFIHDLRSPAHDALTNMALDLSRSISAKRDELIKAAICSRLGTGWTLDDLRGRLECQIDRERVQVIRLAGEPILELHPILTHTHMEEERTMLNVGFRWRLL